MVNQRKSSSSTSLKRKLANKNKNMVGNLHERSKGDKIGMSLSESIVERHKPPPRLNEAIVKVAVHKESVTYYSTSLSLGTPVKTLRPIDFGINDIAYIDDEPDFV